jgi:signal transduction histidine kinase
VLNANKAYREHLQLNEDEAIQACCYHASHQRQEPCIPTLITCPVSKLMDHSLPVKTMQNFIRKNGEYSMVQVFAAPLEIVSADGKEVHVVESIRDLQTDINFSHEQKLSLLGQLAAGVAHEIRNPLGSIRIALQSIMKKLKSDSLDYNDTMHYLELVDGEIDKCVSVTERMLKFSSFPSDQRELVDVNQAIRDVLTLLDFERADKGIQVIKILDDSEPRILASESDIRMLFINLVQNAFHALYKGGELTVRSVVSEEQVTVDFLDNGPGIPYEYKAHIFEPFFSRRPDGRKGTGLGLTISKSIAERYGGTIMVRDVSPSGAQFIVTLPLPDRMEVSATVSS